MNEQNYNTWIKVQNATDEVGSALRKLDLVFADLQDYADDLRATLLEESDSEDIREAVAKYEAFLKVLREEVVDDQA